MYKVTLCCESRYLNSGVTSKLLDWLSLSTMSQNACGKVVKRVLDCLSSPVGGSGSIYTFLRRYPRDVHVGARDVHMLCMCCDDSSVWQDAYYNHGNEAKCFGRSTRRNSSKQPYSIAGLARCYVASCSVILWCGLHNRSWEGAALLCLGTQSAEASTKVGTKLEEAKTRTWRLACIKVDQV